MILPRGGSGVKGALPTVSADELGQTLMEPFSGSERVGPTSDGTEKIAKAPRFATLQTPLNRRDSRAHATTWPPHPVLLPCGA